MKILKQLNDGQRWGHVGRLERDASNPVQCNPTWIQILTQTALEKDEYSFLCRLDCCIIESKESSSGTVTMMSSITLAVLFLPAFLLLFWFTFFFVFHCAPLKKINLKDNCWVKEGVKQWDDENQQHYSVSSKCCNHFVVKSARMPGLVFMMFVVVVVGWEIRVWKPLP